jgi:flagellar hook-associated protein 2
MGSVGINFGSATGGTGFDVTTTVAAIVANLKSVENPWNTQLTALKASDTAFTSIGTDLATLSTAVSALTDFQGVLASKQGSSSNANILALDSAGPTAVAGSHTIVVSQLAQTASFNSAVVLPTDTLSGALTIQVGSGSATTVPIVSGKSDTLSTYAAAINLAGIGVSASVISDTTGSRLSIVSNTSGLPGQLTISSGITVSTSTAVTSAAVSVPSDDSTSATNTFTLPSATDKLSGTFAYAIGGGASATVNLGSTPLSLTATAAALNVDTGFSASGLTATVLGANLVITKTIGSAGSASIDTSASTLTTTTPASTTSPFTDATKNSAIAVTVGLTAQDAKLTVDGSAIDSASNTLSTAIPGVTFQVLSSDPNTQVQVQIANNNSSVVTAVQSFVTAYNTVMSDINTQEGNNAAGSPEPLFGNTVVAQLQSALSLALTAGSSSGGVTSLYKLGISASTADNGTLTLDTTALNATLNSNYQDVVGFLQDSGSFGQSMQNTLDTLGSQSPSGAITLALNADKTQETTLNNNVTAQDALIAKQSSRLTSQLNLANEILQAIPQQLNEINQLYSALTGYNTGSH